MKIRKPLIISASRRTDIPAFYMKDFMSSWKNGFTEWVNPFNPMQKMIVSFEKTELVVFWSKFPVGVLKHLDEFDFDFYLLYTLNDYPELELNLPTLETRLKLFEEISNRIGKYRVIWRFDPIVLTDSITPESIVERFEMLAKRLKNRTFRVIVSFMTPYRKALARMKKMGIIYREPDLEEVEYITRNLGEIASAYGFQIQTCADRFNSDGELERFGLKRGACIDADYIADVFSHNERLVESIKALGKDRGQRRECLCVESIDIGRYGTCRFKCVYCYAL